jgi:pantetheine-phosphate adenylyltransferase
MPTLMADSNQKPLESAILVLPIPSLTEYQHFGPWINHAATNTTNRLLVILVSPLFDVENGGISPTGTWKLMERLISFIYTRASWVAVRLDRVLMRIDVILHATTASILSGIEKEKNYRWNAIFVPEGGSKCSFSDRTCSNRITRIQ